MRVGVRQGLASGTDVAAVSTVPGGVSLFVVNPAHAVESAYFDPRTAE